MRKNVVITEKDCKLCKHCPCIGDVVWKMLPGLKAMTFGNQDCPRKSPLPSYLEIREKLSQWEPNRRIGELAGVKR